MNPARYIVSRRDGTRLNVTHFVRLQGGSPEMWLAWTTDRAKALRMSFTEAERMARWWNDQPAIKHLRIEARVEDADAPEPVSLAKAA